MLSGIISSIRNIATFVRTKNVQRTIMQNMLVCLWLLLVPNITSSSSFTILVKQVWKKVYKSRNFFFTPNKEKLHFFHRSNMKSLLLHDVLISEFRCKNLKSMAFFVAYDGIMFEKKFRQNRSTGAIVATGDTHTVNIMSWTKIYRVITSMINITGILILP
jgi:hypothetical protein